VQNFRPGTMERLGLGAEELRRRHPRLIYVSISGVGDTGPYVKKRLIELTNDAVARGAFGSPTFFVGSEMFFGKDQLRDVEEEIEAQKGRIAKAG